MEPVIRLKSVTKRFGRLTALDDVSLEVPPGVVFALLGENGAGKSTAIRIMLGLAEPDSGRAEVLDLESGTRGLDIRRRVGYVPEQPTLYGWMTVKEIGWFAAGFYADGFLSRYIERVAEFGLPPKQKIQTLSKGMRAKVSLALATASDPELLILDEPTSGLDALVRREFLESMVDRAAAGQTVFLSSHQINEVERVADLVAILREGRILLIEPLDRLKSGVRQLTLTTDNGTPPPDELLGHVLSRRQRRRQWQFMVRDEEPERWSRLEAHPAVRKVEVHVPNLEEIFVAYMQSDELDASNESDNSGKRVDNVARETDVSGTETARKETTP